jgi:hypothetical protein
MNNDDENETQVTEFKRELTVRALQAWDRTREKLLRLPDTHFAGLSPDALAEKVRAAFELEIGERMAQAAQAHIAAVTLAYEEGVRHAEAKASLRELAIARATQEAARKWWLTPHTTLDLAAIIASVPR